MEHSLSKRSAKSDIPSLRAALIRERRELARRLGNGNGNGPREQDDAKGEAAGELSVIDNHPADMGTEMYERSKDAALTELLERQLREADLALARMDEGTYGICRACGEPISPERLQALPSTEYCVSHVPDDRTLRYEFVDRDSPRLAEGEDIWQTVERYGTSSHSPVMPNCHYGVMDDDGGAGAEEDGWNEYVEPIESFLVTDMYGKNPAFVRNGAYRLYMERGEGSEEHPEFQ